MSHHPCNCIRGESGPARHNNCIADEAREADVANGHGTVVSVSSLPILAALLSIIFIGAAGFNVRRAIFRGRPRKPKGA